MRSVLEMTHQMGNYSGKYEFTKILLLLLKLEWCRIDATLLSRNMTSFVLLLEFYKVCQVFLLVKCRSTLDIHYFYWLKCMSKLA